MQPGFVRIEGPEEITPPIARSQDSWSAAKALCSQFPPSAPPPDSQLPVSVSVANDAALTDQPSSPGSPSLAAAAAMLQQVQSTDRDRLEEAEGAVDCLMQLSSDGTAKPSLVQSPKKRPLADDADALKPASRRKLKMKSSPLSEPRFGASAIEHAQQSQRSSMQPVALLSSSNPAQVSPSPRPRVRHRTHMQNRGVHRNTGSTTAHTGPCQLSGADPPLPPPAAEAPGRRLQAMPDADGRAACRDRGPRRHGRGHARQLVPEPPCAAGVGFPAAAGELIEHALHVLQGERGQRRRRRRSSNEIAAVACAFELCLNGRFGAAMLRRGGRCCAEDRRCESRGWPHRGVRPFFRVGGGDLSSPSHSARRMADCACANTRKVISLAVDAGRSCVLVLAVYLVCDGSK